MDMAAGSVGTVVISLCQVGGSGSAVYGGSVIIFSGILFPLVVLFGCNGNQYIILYMLNRVKFCATKTEGLTFPSPPNI